ncbi:hypothetical protein [Halomonas denitrificans]|nr:hypothetical protein [Halomonas denitrificans]
MAWTGLGHAAVELDQYVFGWSPDVPLAVGGSSEQMLAMSYDAGRSGTLARIDLVLGCSEGSPGTVTVELQELAADGTPAGVALSSLSRAADGISLDAGITEFDMPPVAVSAGTGYAVVLSATDDASCATRRGGGPMWHSSGVRDAFFDARPNPPGWEPLTIGGSTAWVPFWVYVETGGGSPDGPRFCDFETADGVPNDWVPNDVPLCSCARDPGLVAHRCWFVTPDFMLWRSLGLPLGSPRARAEWTLVPMVPDLPAVTIEEFDPDGQFGSEPIDFRAGGRPGKAVSRRARYFGEAEVSEILIRVDHADQPQVILFRSTIEIPEPQQ